MPVTGAAAPGADGTVTAATVTAATSTSAHGTADRHGTGAVTMALGVIMVRPKTTAAG